VSQRIRELAATLKVKFFFANSYATCTGCGKEIWADDTVCIDTAGTGLRHEDCEHL
jgi:hypothetical protein